MPVLGSVAEVLKVLVEKAQEHKGNKKQASDEIYLFIDDKKVSIA